MLSLSVAVAVIQSTPAFMMVLSTTGCVAVCMGNPPCGKHTKGCAPAKEPLLPYYSSGVSQHPTHHASARFKFKPSYLFSLFRLVKVWRLLLCYRPLPTFLERVVPR